MDALPLFCFDRRRRGLISMPEEIDHERRRLLGTVARTIGGGQLGGIGRAMAQSVAARLAVEGEIPSLSGGVGWLNSSPLTAGGLRGKVVLIDFWTYTCVNWR